MLAQGAVPPPSGGLSVSPVFARRQKQAPLGEEYSKLLVIYGAGDRSRTCDLLITKEEVHGRRRSGRAAGLRVRPWRARLSAGCRSRCATGGAHFGLES